MDREWPMGEAPSEITNAICSRDEHHRGHKNTTLKRVFTPLSHRWRDGRKGSDNVLERKRDIDQNPNIEQVY